MANTIFYLIAGIIICSAFLVVTLRNLFHCALFLALAMFGVSGVFLFLNFEFLAIVQVLIYVGAVTVLIIFGIMLTRNVMDDKTRVLNKQVFLAIIAAAAVMTISFSAVGKSVFFEGDHPTITMAETSAAPDPPKPSSLGQNDVYALGLELIRPEKGYAFSFEFVSVLLLSALVGAIVVARKEKS